MGAAIAKRWNAAAGAAAAFAGHALRTAPGVLGAVMVSVGLGLAWLPLGIIAGGAFLLLVDRRMP